METYSFGEWIKQRRKQLRLTQREVAGAAYCSVAMIKKIEADERRPSSELADYLAEVLSIPTEQHHLFINVARGRRPVEYLVEQPARKAANPPVKPSNDYPLPMPATPFVGRTKELEAVTKQLRRHEVRLVTLLGTGGIGKTRLAVEVARQLRTDFVDGVLFVSLASISESSQIPPAIFQASNLSLAGNDPPLVQVKRFLRRRQILLILDNFEQLVAGAEILADLLRIAPGLKLLVTSRERLDLAEEWLFPVPELDEAVALFGQTAVRVKPDFDNVQEETTVTHICQLVEGHPLAVELAASWTRFMPCSQIAAQIQKDLDFLAHGPRNAPERHRSLRAMFDHSWRLLDPLEQAVLAKLSVFKGGFRAEEAAVGAEADWSMLLRLVDKSLVEPVGDGRLDLHPLTRQYAFEKLTESGQLMAARRAHFDTYAGLAEQIFHWFGGIKAADSFRQVIVDHKNLQAALEWGLEVQEIEAVSAVLSNLFVLWLRAGYWQEGERLNASALAKKGKDVSVSRCLLLAQLGIFIVLQGRYSEAFPHVEQAYKLARRLEDPWCLAITLHIQGQAQSDQTKAMAAYDEVIDICQSHPEIPHCKSFLGGMLSLKGDRLVNFGLFAEAKASYEASLAQFRSLGETFQIAYPLGNLGRMALQDGQLQEAERLIAESTALTKRTGNRVGIADWSFRLGQVQFYLGNLTLAEQNLQTALEMYEEIGQPFGPTGVLSMMSLVAIAQGRLSDAGSLIQNCFAEYRRLLAANQKVDFASDFLNFGDTIESLLYAGLVAHAQGDWQTALYFFSFCKNNTSNFEPVRPLQEKIAAARTEIQNNLPRETFDTVLAQTETLTLDELLATSFDNSSSN